MKTAIIIPARLESTRFPEKMLAKVDKQHNLIQRVHHWCCCFHDKEDVYVATDSKRVAALFPNQSILTSPDCVNGTSRVADAIKNNRFDEYENFINVQGDMIDVPPVFEEIRNALRYYPVVTVCTDLPNSRRSDPSCVKVAGTSSRAVWFGRGFTGYGNWHLGIYGFNRWALSAYDSLDVYDGELEESLEQLRWIYNNIPVGIVYTDDPCDEINTEEDLKRWQSIHQN